MRAERSEAINSCLSVLRSALRLCEDALSAMPIRPGAKVPDRFVKAFFAKATRTVKAITLLYEHGLSEEAQSLVRILFELHVSFSTFVMMLRRNVVDACGRLLDSVMIEKVKQQRASDFRGLDLVPGAPSREVLENDERLIASRYKAEEYAALRKHGFSGKSMEQRCRALDQAGGGTGFSEIYNIVYRNFSRNVHSTDLTESLLHVDPTLVTARTRDLVESRDGIACDVVLRVALSFVDAINREFELGLGKRVANLKRLHEGRT